MNEPTRPSEEALRKHFEKVISKVFSPWRWSFEIIPFDIPHHRRIIFIMKEMLTRVILWFHRPPCKHILVPGEKHCAVCHASLVLGRV
jgi:hypothetical protein